MPDMRIVPNFQMDMMNPTLKTEKHRLNPTGKLPEKPSRMNQKHTTPYP